MRELLHQYFNIAFLMGKPQDLPGGTHQMKVGVALAFVTYLMALAVPYGISRAVLQAVIDLGSTALILYIALLAAGHRARFEQAFGGLCGASAFINLAAVPLYAMNSGGQGAQSASLGMIPDFMLLVWGLSLLGHIIRHSFEVGLALSILISFVYFVFLSTLIAAFLPLGADVQSSLSLIESGTLFAVTPGPGEWLSS